MRKFGILLTVMAVAIIALSNTVTNDVVIATSDAELRISDRGLGLGLEVVGGGAAEVKLEARPGWRFRDGSTSVTLNKAAGSSAKSPAVVGEGQGAENYVPGVDVNDDESGGDENEEGSVDHEKPVLSLTASAPKVVAYSVFDGGTNVSISLSTTVTTKGKHRKLDANGNVVKEEKFSPKRYVWKMTGAATGEAETDSSTHTFVASLTKGKDKKLNFSVVGKICSICDGEVESDEATDSVEIDVYELSISRPDYLGLDRADAGRQGHVVKTARLSSDPSLPSSSSIEWKECGICEFVGAKNQRSVSYQNKDSETASKLVGKERLAASVTLTGMDSAFVCSTNFTVVKVDVTIGGVGEEKEEKEGAFIPFVRDETNGVISVEGTNKLVLVKLTCEPDNLPTNEIVRVLCAGPAELYQKLSDGKLVRVVSTNYFANEISNLEFVLHGHNASGACKDGLIKIEHLTSGAVDVAKYTSVKVNVEITDFPTKTLLGEDKEEMPGAFIPYAADWAFEETESSQADIPFGPSAQEKLVDVYVSYEPSDLPEHEDGGGKFLVFEAPSDSLYLPAYSAGSDQLWMEFVGWWNSRPPSWSLAFEGKKRLVLHGHTKSSSQRDWEIRITHPKSGATDVAMYTVYHVDLDIDSDNDLQIEGRDGFEDAIEEREPGKIISWDQSGISSGQDYRVPLRLKAWGGETNAVVRLDTVASSSRVAEIYRTESGGSKLDLPFYFPADSIPLLYVDGVTNGTISITATLTNPPEGVSAASSVRPIPGLEIAKDKVAALVIQPISFAPSGGAAVWSSIPNDVLDGDGVLFDSMISNQGYKVTWYRDGNGEGDLGVGDCTANAYLNLDGYGAVTIISHGGTNEHLAVYFPYTTAGYNAASSWIADIQYSGGHVSDMIVKDARNQRNRYWYVSVNPRWFEKNWKTGFDKRNSVVLWASCFSATLLNCCGGRWRSGYVNPTGQGECSAVNSQFLRRMNGGIGAGALRPAGMAYSHGRSSMSNNVRMEGIPWTTLCPAPIIGTPTFPSSNLSEGDVAFGCLLLDTFVKAKSNMIKVIAGDGVTGIAPLRQEGAKYPFGVGFRIKKGSGTIKVKSEALKIYIESATPNDEFATGKTMDADRITPNGGIVEWEF